MVLGLKSRQSPLCIKCIPCAKSAMKGYHKMETHEFKYAINDALNKINAQLDVEKEAGNTVMVIALQAKALGLWATYYSMIGRDMDVDRVAVRVTGDDIVRDYI